MRADRLLTMILLLQRDGRMTARRLAEALGVTERTIYRDIEALNYAGVPVYTRSGPDGGCFLDDDYRAGLHWFTGAELQALLAGGSAAPLSALGMEQAAESAVLKLLALAPSRRQQEAALMRQRLYLDPSEWYGAAEEEPDLPALKEAVWEDRWIDADYETWEGERARRTLAAYSLVYKAGRWYLVAVSRRSGAMRTYRAARLRQVRLLPERFERDRAFDIAAYWRDAAAEFAGRIPTYPVVLRVAESALIYFRTVLPGRGEILETVGGRVLLRVNYTVFEEARASVLGLGADAEVIEPAELGAAVLEQARAILAKAGQITP
ncbi:MAG: YafY family transcriptional regulator [Anaerolineae bacterium]|nr:YafY family transcriptional regulator [Anaerolineae bacterium]NUQ05905.1 YafY family transcriptional regulator [Anaerolineae bacterium]